MRRGKHYWVNPKTRKFEEFADLTVDRKAPFIIPDTMNKTHCNADGKIYESRSAMKAAVKAAGCDTIGWKERIRWQESNNLPDIEKDMKIAYNDLKYGNAYLTEEDKNYCKETNERIRRK